MKQDKLKIIVQVILSMLTALATTLGVTSCGIV